VVKIVMPHWSATRFMLFDQCPGEFKARYVDGVALEPTEALCFGKAVHTALECHYNGGDGERLFRTVWKSMVRDDLGGRVNKNLTGMGIELLDKVIALDLHGTPELPIAIDSNFELGAPIVGAIDLYDEQSETVYDFKTTRGTWSQERAQAERWQPLLYTLAIWYEHGVWPAFEYIVLNRVTGALSRFRREWTQDEWLEQMNAAWLRASEISVAVAQGRLECHGNHGFCPECGERWEHDHICDEGTYSKRVTLRKVA